MVRLQAPASAIFGFALGPHLPAAILAVDLDLAVERHFLAELHQQHPGLFELHSELAAELKGGFALEAVGRDQIAKSIFFNDSL